MLEAQAHLPSQDNQHHIVSNCHKEASNGDNDDGGDDGGTDKDEDGNGDDDDAGSGWDDHARLQCPYPVCNRKRRFNTRQDLVRHFQLRISPRAPKMVVC